MAKRKKKWIQKARQLAMEHHHVGALHRALHVPKGEKIPFKKLQRAAKKKGKLGMRARFAIVMRKIAPRRRRRVTHRRHR